jgi:Tfp pilus assembly protein PilN
VNGQDEIYHFSQSRLAVTMSTRRSAMPPLLKGLVLLVIAILLVLWSFQMQSQVKVKDAPRDTPTAPRPATPAAAS